MIGKGQGTETEEPAHEVYDRSDLNDVLIMVAARKPVALGQGVCLNLNLQIGK